MGGQNDERVGSSSRQFLNELKTTSPVISVNKGSAMKRTFLTLGFFLMASMVESTGSLVPMARVATTGPVWAWRLGGFVVRRSKGGRR